MAIAMKADLVIISVICLNFNKEVLRYLLLDFNGCQEPRLRGVDMVSVLVGKHFTILSDVDRAGCHLVSDTAAPVDRPVHVAPLYGVCVAVAGDKFPLSSLGTKVNDLERHFSLDSIIDPNGAVNDRPV